MFPKILKRNLLLLVTVIALALPAPSMASQISRYAAGWTASPTGGPMPGLDWSPLPPNPNPLGPPDSNCIGTSNSGSVFAQFTFASFHIPSGDTIVGIEVNVNYGSFDATDMQLYLRGSPVGSTRVLPATPPTMTCNASVLRTAGGSADTWGAGLTAADFNSAGTVAVRLARTLGSSNSIDIESVQLVVHYANPADTHTTIAFSPNHTVPEGTFVTITGRAFCDEIHGDVCLAIGQELNVGQILIQPALDDADAHANCASLDHFGDEIGIGNPPFSIIFDTTGIGGQTLGFSVLYLTPGGEDAPATTRSVCADLAIGATDTDNDGVLDDNDLCPETAANDDVGVFGCSQAQVDSDGDGVCNADAPAGAGGPPPGCMGSDACPATLQGETVNADGCSDTQLDTDNDGVTDAEDNCPFVFNDGQEDLDGDDVGDVCDDDIDGDNVLNDDDNCRINANEDQTDNDLDTIGDVCDPDDDNDNVLDGDDNCRINANEDQADNDSDTIGDVCDPDDDNDGVDDDVPDNCPFDANPNQEDADSDGLGDVCDPDDDNDGVADGDDVCPATVIPEAVPTSSRGLGRNRWTLENPDGSFTQGPPQAGRMFSFTTADTRGCSCEQIIDGLGLGKGHSKYGCSNSAMIDWGNMQQ